MDVASNVAIARNLFGILESLHCFISGSSKRNQLYIEQQEKSGIHHPVTLKALSDTRWSCRIDSLRSLNVSMEEVLYALEIISEIDSDRRALLMPEGYWPH